MVRGAVACFLSSSPKANSLKFKDGSHGGWQNKCRLRPAALRPWRHFSQKLSCSLQLFGKTLARWCRPLRSTSTHMVMTTSRTKTGSPRGLGPWLYHSLLQNKVILSIYIKKFKPECISHLRFSPRTRIIPRDCIFRAGDQPKASCVLGKCSPPLGTSGLHLQIVLYSLVGYTIGTKRAS